MRLGDGTDAGNRQSRGAAPDPQKLIVCGGCTCVFAVAFAILAFTSLGAVGPTELALRQNNFNKIVFQDTPYGPGRFWIWPWCSFLKFPSTVQTIEFSPATTNGVLKVKTTDKFEVELHLSFQYQLDSHTIGKLYQNYARAYERQFRQIAKERIQQVGANYKARDYWENRHKLGGAMLDRVTPEVQKVYANVTGLQILLIVLPKLYEKTIEQKQVTEQQKYTATNEQVAATIRADTDVMIADYQKNVTITRNGAKAAGTQMVKLSEAQAISMQLGAEGDALDEVTKKLSLTGPGLNEYMRLFAYQQVKNATLLFGVDHSVAVLTPGKAKKRLGEEDYVHEHDLNLNSCVSKKEADEKQAGDRLQAVPTSDERIEQLERELQTLKLEKQIAELRQQKELQQSLVA